MGNQLGERMPTVVRELRANGTNGHAPDYAGADDFVREVAVPERRGLNLEQHLAKAAAENHEAEIKRHLRSLTFGEMIRLAKDFGKYLAQVPQSATPEEAKSVIEEKMAHSLNDWACSEPSEEEPGDTPPPYDKTVVE